MQRPFQPLFLVLPLVLAACGKPQVTVQAELARTGSDAATPIADLPVRLIPYDRDAILDSLTKAANEPEPALPSDLDVVRDSLAAAQVAWRAEEARLHAIEDTIPTLVIPVGADPAVREAMLVRTRRLDQEQREVKQRLGVLQARIAAYSRAIGTAVDSVRVARQRWSETVLKDFDRIAEEKIRAAGRTGAVDTTSRSGAALLRVEEGRWWVYARYALPDAELYWNLPVEVTGETTRVLLNDANAEKRPLF
jgi:hypothetical protein